MRRLLIVDDEADVLEGLCKLFRQREDPELDIYRALSGRQALSILEEERIDVVLSDIRMPGMTGLQLLSEVHSRWPRCRVIFLTGYTDFDSIYEATRQGADTYLLKTEEREKIIGAVDEAFAALAEDTRLQALEDRLARYAASERFYANREILSELIAESEHGNGRVRRLITRLEGFEDRSLWIMAVKLDAAVAEPLKKVRILMALDEGLGAWLGGVAVAAGEVERSTGLVLVQREGLTVSRVRGAAEAVQSALVSQWDARVSMALFDSPAAVNRVPHYYRLLRQLLTQMFPFGSGIIVTRDGVHAQSAGSKTRAITMVKEYVTAHLEDDLSLTLLASKVFLNPSYLSRLFSQETGVTLVGYINSIRIAKARELLAHTNMRIADIAARVGLESPSYFNQVFHRYVGMSPQAFRMKETL